MPSDLPAQDVDLPKLFSLVPGAAPIELVAYYPRFAEYYREAELQTKRWMTRNARPDWVAIDVGANVGLYSLLLSRLLVEGRIHAFEPTETAQLLRRNLAAQGAANVELHEVALGARSGVIEEPIYRIWGAAPETQAYRFSTLDDFVREAGLERLDCVKIDVDGFDLEVLRGGARSLQIFNPWVVIELNHALATRGQSVGEALLWLIGQGYTEALVLDEENFVLRRGSAMAGQDGLRLAFDREPILLPPVFGPGTPLPDLFAAEPVLHNAARLEGERIIVPGPRWAYAASWPVQVPPSAGPTIVQVEIEIDVGQAGIGCLTADMGTMLGSEVMLSAAPGPQTARLFIPEGADIGHLILRNVEENGAPARARLRATHAARAKPATVPYSAVLDHQVESFALDQALDPTGPAVPARSIRIVPVEALGNALGLPVPYVPERILYRYGLEHFKTEIDEPGIYRYLYRQLAPRRHLEFGTWEGFGTVLCAESCAAEIWTVNLPEGERGAKGMPLYAAQRLPGEAAPAIAGAGDAGERIGWRYRAAGYGPRVHQLLCDSREFPASQFAPGYFDTVLIDGGHTADIVANDTDKALGLLRPGGMMLWHDFCPDQTALATSEAGRGVMRGWVANYDRWRPLFADLFWVRPSWLLIGVKA